MATRNVVKKEDTILRKQSRVVTKFDERLWELLDDMAETMYADEGVGLAAVQVASLKRAVVVDIQDGRGITELINPVIVERRGQQHELEGCLSVPGRQGYTDRPMYVKVEALNRRGEMMTYEGEGLLARAFCHEIDHLDGILYIDHAEMVVEE